MRELFLPESHKKTKKRNSLPVCSLSCSKVTSIAHNKIFSSSRNIINRLSSVFPCWKKNKLPVFEVKLHMRPDSTRRPQFISWSGTKASDWLKQWWRLGRCSALGCYRNSVGCGNRFWYPETKSSRITDNWRPRNWEVDQRRDCRYRRKQRDACAFPALRAPRWESERREGCLRSGLVGILHCWAAWCHEANAATVYKLMGLNQSVYFADGGRLERARRLMCGFNRKRMRDDIWVLYSMVRATAGWDGHVNHERNSSSSPQKTSLAATMFKDTHSLHGMMAVKFRPWTGGVRVEEYR